MNDASFVGVEIRMPYRRTENVVRRLTARHDAILAAACEIAAADGMGAVQIAPVAERAGIATGTVYRYFPSKTELVAALVAALAEREMAALGEAAKSAPGPLSALAAAIATFAARALARRRLAFALIAEPVEPEIDRARAAYRQKLTGEFARLIRRALDAGRLPEQDAGLTAPALLGALIEGLIGERAPAAPANPGEARARVQMLTLFALRALGVNDARARGLVVQTAMPEPRGDS
jgi:AcrR family transcriptional regulator